MSYQEFLILNRFNFLHTNAREIVTNQWQNVNKIQTSGEEAKLSRSHLCTLLTVISFPVGAVRDSSKEANLEAGVTWGVELKSSDSICQSTLLQVALCVSSGINPILHCVVPTTSSSPNKPTAMNELRATTLHCFCIWER